MVTCGGQSKSSITRMINLRAAAGSYGPLLRTTFLLIRLCHFIQSWTSSSLLCVSVRLYPNQGIFNRQSGKLLIFVYIVRGMLQWQTGLRALTRLQPQNARLGIIQPLDSHFRREQSFHALSTVSPNLENKRFNESLTPEHAIYLSTSTDPLFNLTLEDWYVSFKLLVSSGFWRFTFILNVTFTHVVMSTLDFCHLQAFSQRLRLLTAPVDLP